MSRMDQAIPILSYGFFALSVPVFAVAWQSERPLFIATAAAMLVLTGHLALDAWRFSHRGARA